MIQNHAAMSILNTSNVILNLESEKQIANI